MVSEQIKQIQKHISELRGRQKGMLENIEYSDIRIRDLKRATRLTEQAALIIQNVAQLTQQELQFQISDIVTLALASVFNEPYEFKIDFIIRRDRTECDLWFVRSGNTVHPLTASGGGAVDVACFALRVALWKLSTQKTRPVLVLDEPFKHLSSDLQERAAQVIKEISEKLGIQIIMISHVNEIIESADKIIQVKIKKGVSECQEK